MKHGCAARCHRCNMRRALPRSWSSYVRTPRCRACGRELRVDNYRNKVEAPAWRKATCYGCGGMYPFPHRRGSKFCAHNPEFELVAGEHHHFNRAERFEPIPF